MKKRLVKKNNTIQIKRILAKIEQAGYTVSSTTFGSGYFLYRFGANSVCEFELKKFPEWKFGVWLNNKNPYNKNKSFSIFGENVYCIDKFKPSRTVLSKATLSEFLEHLDIIYDLMTKKDRFDKKETKVLTWSKYLTYTEKYKQEKFQTNYYNQLILKNFTDIAKSYGSSALVIIKNQCTRNLKISPEYIVDIAFLDKEVSDIDACEKIVNIYKQFCLFLDSLKISKKLYLDDYFFNSINAVVITPLKHFHQETRLGRSGDFNKYLETLCNECKSKINK